MGSSQPALHSPTQAHFVERTETPRIFAGESVGPALLWTGSYEQGRVPSTTTGQDLLGKHFFKPHHGIHMLNTDGQGTSPTSGDAVVEVTKLQGETGAGQAAVGSTEPHGGSSSQTQRSQRTGPPSHTAHGTAVKALSPERPCARSRPSREPQPDLSFRPLASALRKPFPGPAGEPPPRKGCVLPTTCLPAPRCSPPCSSRVGQARPSQPSRCSELLLSAGEDRGGHGWPGIPTGKALGGTQGTRAGPGDKEGVIWVQEGGKGLNGGPGSCSC